MDDTQPKLEIDTLLAHTDFLETELARTRITRDRWETSARALHDQVCVMQTERDNANALCKAARSVANTAEDKADNVEVMIEGMEHNLRVFEKLAQDRLTEHDEARAVACRLLRERDEAQDELAKATERTKFLQDKHSRDYDFPAHLMRQSALMVHMYQAYWKESAALKNELAELKSSHDALVEHHRDDHHGEDHA